MSMISAETMLPRTSRVLIVDDDPVNLKIWGEALKGVCRTAVASDGQSAIAIFSSFRPDLVVLDRMMPGMHGDEVLAAIRRLDIGHSTRVVMHSALGRVAEQVAGMEKGADLYITKTVDIAVAVTQVRSLLSMQRNDSSAILATAMRRLRKESNGFAADLLIRGIMQHTELSSSEINAEETRLDFFLGIVRKLYSEQLLGRNMLLDLTISPDCDDTIIIANRELLNGLLVHCLDIMIRCSSLGAHIGISLTPTKEFYITTFTTSCGTGLTPDELNRMFIFDVESAEGRDHIGTALAWETAVRHGGDLTAHNNNEGRPVITMTFPRATVAARISA